MSNRRSRLRRTQTSLRGGAGSTFNPKDIPGLALWLAPGTGITTVSGAVSSWADLLSGSGITVSQGTAGQRPTYNASGGPTSYPILTLAGASSQNLTVSAAVLPATHFTIFTVQHNTSAAATGYTFYVGNANTPNGLGVGATASKNDVFYSGAAHLLGSATTTNWEQWTVNYTGTTTTLRVNGTAQALTNSATAPIAPGANTTIGGNLVAAQYWTGDIGEIIAYNISLSAAQVSLIEAYLLAKWGV